MKHRSVLVRPILLAAAVVAGSAVGAQADVNRLLQCGSGSNVARFSAIYSERGSAKKPDKQLDVDLEINKNAGYKEGQLVVFLLDGKKIGQQRLAADAHGDLDADLKLTSKGSGAFPSVKSGQTIAAEIRNKNLGDCIL